MDTAKRKKYAYKKVLGIVILLIVIGIFGVFSWVHGITSKIFIPHSTAATNSIQQSMSNKTPFNILLLGYGGGNHDGAYLTDSIMVVHIDPKNQKVFLISIPRDIWIKIPTDGQTSSYWKINAAYTIGMDDQSYPNKQPQFKGSDGAGHLAEYIVQQVTGLPIQYFVGMDFAGFTKTIDTLGGVDINVETAFDDYQYPITGQEDATCGLSKDQITSLSAQVATGSATENEAFPCRYEHLHFNSGLQDMDGTTALKYVRSRHSLQDGTDFGRAKRQRNLLVAVKQKVFSAGFLPQAIPFMNSLGDDVKTDLTLDDVRTLLQSANTLNKYPVTTLALTDQNFLQDAVSSDGQDILEPKDGVDNWTSVHNWLADTLSNKPQPVQAIVQVANGTPIAGLAGLATNRLKNENIEVLVPTDATNQAAQKTTITLYSKNISNSDLVIIKKEFGVTAITYATNGNQINYNVLVTVGQDYNQLQGKKLLNEP